MRYQRILNLSRIDNKSRNDKPRIPKPNRRHPNQAFMFKADAKCIKEKRLESKSQQNRSGHPSKPQPERWANSFLLTKRIR